MSWRPLDHEDPHRLYTVTGGRSRAPEGAFDLVTLIVSECGPTPGMPSEHARILEVCRRPTAVVALAAELNVPVSVGKILLCDLLDTGRISASRPAPDHPHPAPGPTRRPDLDTLEQVLVGLRRL